MTPALPVGATWFLPLEKWLWEKVPKKILGPYLIYAAFVEWHFKFPWWSIGIVSIFGVVASTVAISEINSKKS